MELPMRAMVNKYAFLLGIIEKDEFLAFIDEVIAAEDEPPYEFIEVALNANKSPLDIVSPINEYLFKMDIDLEKFSYGLLAVIRQKYLDGEDYKLIVSKMSRLPCLLPEFYNMKGGRLISMYCLDDYIPLAEEGVYGTPEDMKNQFEVLLGLRNEPEIIKETKRYNGFIKKLLSLIKR